ncbi:MAG: sulfide:quinone oxidoreductase [bacterium]|jgi:sulfide:quinone oxidoreductase
MTVTDDRVRVLIAGGGIAGLELLLALRVLAGSRVAVTLLTADGELAPRAMTVAEPFGRGGARSWAWADIARDQDAELVIDKLIAIDTAARRAFTAGGRRMPYDILVVTTGARRVAPLRGGLTFGLAGDAPAQLGTIVDGLLAGASSSIAFALTSPSHWSLPLYELALLTAHELREHGCDATVRLVTAEQQPLALFGPAAADAIRPLLDALAVELITCARPLGILDGALRLADGELAADHVVTLAEITARSVPGLPVDRAGFVPVDAHGRVCGEDAVYAAGEATSFPLRQGGLAAQQADAVAEAIAAACGAGNVPRPFRPVLRGRLLTSGAPLYLQSRPSGQSVASTRALWSPPEKVAGRLVAPYLATARPPRLAAAALTERVPVVAGAPPDDRDAMTLALALAEAHARHGNAEGWLQALEAGHALDPDATVPIARTVGEIALS